MFGTNSKKALKSKEPKLNKACILFFEKKTYTIYLKNATNCLKVILIVPWP